MSYVGNGIVKEFAIPFKFFEDSDIEIYFKSNAVPQKLLSIGDDYVLSGAGNDNGGTAVLVKTPESGDKIVILRVVPMTQEVDYRENEIFPAETQERALDKLTMEVQQLNEKLTRSVIVPVTGDGSPEEIVEEVLAAQADVDEWAKEASSSAQAAQSAQTAAQTARDEAVAAVDGFDAHAAQKQSEIDEALEGFDEHAAEKQAAIDDAVSKAQAYGTAFSIVTWS